MLPGVAFRNRASLAHETGGGHPERKERVTAIEGLLDEHGWLGMEVRDSEPATDGMLHLVHPPAYVDAIRDLCAAGGGWIDGDTVASPGTYEAAACAAGGAVGLVDELLGPSDVRVGLSVHRPPGHHAEAAQAMGFCFFNNVAVAARRAIHHHHVERVLILDWDVHHGNGTNDIFWTVPEVLFCSIHQLPLYPGSGPADDVGGGPGRGWTVNLPVPPGSGDLVYGSLVEHVVCALARATRPGLLLVSAGFDAHRDDPLASCQVTDDGYTAMASSMRRLADELDVPLGVVLEGGYDLGALSRGTLRTMEAVLADAPLPAPGDALPVHELSAAALTRFGAFHPELAGA